MKKIFVPFSVMRNNAMKLAVRIYKDGFIPDVIYVPLRGGAYLGNIISEFFKLVIPEERPVFYAAVVARSYTNLFEHARVMVDGWTYDPKYLRHGDRILLVDDIFDSGRTINHLINVLIEKGVPRRDIRIAVHDWKDFISLRSSRPLHPDYYCVAHVIESSEEDVWIHYLTHEIQGLTQEEIDQYFFPDGREDPELRDYFTLVQIPPPKKVSSQR